MHRKTASGTLLVLLIMSFLTPPFAHWLVEAEGTVNLEHKESFYVTTSTYDQSLLVGSVAGYGLNAGDVLFVSWEGSQVWYLSAPRMYLLTTYQFQGWQYSRKLIGLSPASRGWLMKMDSWDTTVNYSITLPDTYYVIIDNTNWDPSILPPSTQIIRYDAWFVRSIAYSVHLESREDNSASNNVGMLGLDGSYYSLPQDASKGVGNHTLGYWPGSDYKFVQWEVSGSMSVSNPYQLDAVLTVAGNGSVTAVYQKLITIWTVLPADFGTLYVQPGHSVDLVLTIAVDPSSNSPWICGGPGFGSYLGVYMDTLNLLNQPFYPEIYPGDTWIGTVYRCTVKATTPLGTECTIAGCVLSIGDGAASSPSQYDIPVRIIAGAPPPQTYNVTINAHCNTEGVDVSVPITMDGSSSGHSTAYTFTGLNGTHTFTVPSNDTSGHPFLHWSTGQTSTTITVSSNGTYTAYYQASTPPTYSATINAHCNTEGGNVAVNLTMDGSPTGYATPHTFTNLTGTHTFTVVNSDPNGHPFLQWGTSQKSTTIAVSSAGTYTAYYQATTGVTYTVNLDSRQDTLATSHLGNVTLDAVTYSLPGWTSKTSGTYSIQYTITSGYEFDHWETTGGVNVTNPNSQSTSTTVSDNGNLTAVYKKSIINYTVYLTSSEDNGTATNLGTINFDNQSFTLPNNVTKVPATYSINYIPTSGNKFLRWETLSNLTVTEPNLQSTNVTVNGTGTIRAIFVKHTPEPPSNVEAKAYYTSNSFFLAGMPNLVPPNQYFVRGTGISMVEFTVSLNGTTQTTLDTSPDGYGWFSSGNIDMAQVTSNLTVVAYGQTGDSTNFTINTNVLDTPYWLKSLIEDARRLHLTNVTVQPGHGLDNVWSLSASVNWPEIPIAEDVDINLPIIGGKYGIEGSFAFTLDLQSDAPQATADGGGGLQFYVADAEAKIGIYVTSTITTQSRIKLESLAIRVSGSVQVPFKHDYSWNGIGIEVGIYVGGSVSLNLNLREATSGDGTFGCGLDWVRTDADIALWVGAYAQVGFWKGEVRVEGEGKVTFTFHVPPPYFTYPDDLKVEARITLTVRFWWFSWQKDVFSYSSHSPVQWKLESSETGWIPRTWANGNYSLYKWIANSTEGTYLENVYLYANPSIDVSSDRTIMVWTHDDLSKPYIQGYEIYYATWDENAGNWSLPTPVTNDMIPEGDAVVKFDSNGNAVAVWTQVNNPVLNETVDPFSLLKDVELAYAVWNPQSKMWSQPKQITSNRAFDYAPTLVSDDTGKLMLVWMVDEDGYVSTYNDKSIYSSPWNGSAWSSPTRVANPGLVASPVSGAYHDGKAVLVWSEDMDGNATTLGDVEVFESEFNGSSWSVPARLTNNTFEDATPSVAFWNDYPVFTWVERIENETDALMFLDPHGSNVPALMFERPRILSPLLKVDSQNQLLAIWSDNVLPYSGIFYPDGRIKIAEMFKEENNNESSIYCGTYDCAAGMVDVNFDGQINILDVTLVAKAFTAKPGNSTWNPDADLDGSGVIDIVDVAKVARKFQKTFSNRIHCRRIVVFRNPSQVSVKPEASESVNSSILSPHSLHHLQHAQ